MAEEVAKGIYRIGVILPKNPLKETNAYYIPGKDRDLLIDTGFFRDECRQSLNAGLTELGSRRERRDVYITHRHADHSGLADEMAAEDGKIYMGEIDLENQKKHFESTGPKERFVGYRENGFPPQALEEMDKASPRGRFQVPPPDERYIPVKEGDIIEAGDYRFQVIVTPGHTPGHTMLWSKEAGIMITGDHVLFDISPNITTWLGFEDPLGDYIGSLRKVRDYPVKTALPGHRKSGDYQARVDELLAHHEWRLRQIYEIIKETPGISAYDIAGQVTWRMRARNWDEFPLSQKSFAFSECMAHLDHLLKRGSVVKTEKDGIFGFYALPWEGNLS